MSDNDREPYAVFRRIEGGVGWKPDHPWHWQADLFDPALAPMGSVGYPCAVAWITDDGATSTVGAVLDYILVPDHLRRRGYAGRLIAACRARWPGIWLTEATSPEGEALAASVERDRRAKRPERRRRI